MIGRCHDPKSDGYKKYGARGIVVCERWRKDSQAFLADMGERLAGLTLGRIDNSGHYEPGNCRWETMEQQANNTRRTRFSPDGEPLALACRRLGVDINLVGGRLQRGWSFEDAISAPVKPKKKTKAAIA
jgi:hypothetical protein